MHKTITTFIMFVMSAACAIADAVGTWRLYPSYNDITEIAPAGTKCFALASGGLFAYDTTDGAVTTYDKASTLTDAGISHIAWSAAAKRLVVAYDNGNIDIVSADGTVANVPGLYNSAMTGDKTINHIYIDGTNAYLATGFGVMKLDVRRAAITDTYQIGFGVDHTYSNGDGYLYAASHERGTYRGLMADNLSDPSNWQRTADYTPDTTDRLNMRDATTGMWWTRSTDGRLTYYTLDADGQREYKTEGILPEGPASNNFYRLYMHGRRLYGVAGLWAQEKDGDYPGEVHVWDGTGWSEFEQPTEATLGHRNVDWLCMDFDPLTEGHTMVGAKSGLYEFQNGRFVKNYNMDNSPIESNIDNKDYAIVSSLKYDGEGNLWLLNREANYPIKQLTKDGEWKQYQHPELGEDDKWNLTSLFISQRNGLMWFVNDYWSKTCLYAYDHTSDQLTKLAGTTYTNEDGTDITPYFMYTASEDKDGNIWMATSSGPLYMAPADFQTGIVTQHKVPRNDGTNLADYLLANVETRKIAFDGANRKWIGTSNGVFLISDDCDTQLQHFTTDNSPLPSNIVLDIIADPSSSTVYFATDKGLCSYESDATQPSDVMTKDNVYAYPNPVGPDYTGMITIVGLSYNADVKIVTSNGTLVNQGRSTGGSYRWDGRDLKGRRVASGVYMVEAATENGEKGTVCKIGIVN